MTGTTCRVPDEWLLGGRHAILLDREVRTALSKVNLIMRIIQLFLLDRNAVSCIKDANAGKEPTDEKRKTLLERLRNLDQIGVRISPLLSIIEGEKGRADTAEEKAACVLKEAGALERFYRNAQVDSQLLRDTVDLASETFAGCIEEFWGLREEFLNFAFPQLGGGVPKEKRSAIEAKLIAEARRIGLQAGDPALMLNLAALYGGRAARELLKPTKMKLYNALSDLHVVSRLGLFLATARKLRATLSIEVVTLDQGLDGVLRGIELVDQTPGEGGALKHHVRYSASLFDELSRDEALDVTERVLTAYDVSVV